jgi:hypothetical protein
MNENQIERLLKSLEGIQAALEKKSSWTPKPKVIRTCPDCKNTTALRPDKINNSGWYCWKKLGGCGKKNMTEVDITPKVATEDVVPIEPKVIDLFGGKQISNEDIDF